MRLGIAGLALQRQTRLSPVLDRFRTEVVRTVQIPLDTPRRVVAAAQNVPVVFINDGATVSSDSLNAGAVDQATARVFVERLLAGFNAHDPEKFTEVMVEDVVFEHSNIPDTLHGRRPVGEYYKRVWRAFPDLLLELDDGPFFHPAAPRISLCWKLTGTHGGIFEPPGLAPTGNHVSFDVRETIELRDGLGSYFTVVSDNANIARQMGTLPAQGSRAEKAMAAAQRFQVRLSRKF